MSNKIKSILLSILVYGIPIILWSIMPFTKSRWGVFTDDFILNFLFYGTVKYSVMGILFDVLLLYCIYLLFQKEKDITNSRAYMICSGAVKLYRWIFIDQLRKNLLINREEKVSLLFYLVKIYFTPVMLGFLIDNTNSLVRFLPNISKLVETIGFSDARRMLLSLIYPTIFHFILVIDTLIFTFGYVVESKSLKNAVKSVEPTALGWLVTVMCYPPINNLTANILGWYSSDFANFGNININVITGAVSILFFIIYVWASIALGFKASNLTNRGIVSHGPYRYIRHPAYASKNLSWWIMGIPFIKASGFVAVFSLSVWTLIYFLRALTEERHLLQDPDYVEYSKKVKYMFIPGLF